MKIRYIRIIIFIILLIISIGACYFKFNTFVCNVTCKIVESNEERIVFKQTLWTFDPDEYGTDVYFIVSDPIVEEINTRLTSKSINRDGNIQMTFEYNKLFDIKKEQSGVYFRVRKLVDIETSDFTPPL